MSDTSPQPLSRREQKRAERARRRADKAERKDTKRAVNRGQKMLKAGYALAGANRMRIDPAIREQIGRAGLSPGDLQAMAHAAVNARFQPERYGNLAQELGQQANARLAQAGPAPRNNWITRHNRYSRWRRNERAGTKALKQAFTRAARDVKKTDPAVLAAIGRSQFNSMDLAAFASGRIGRVFQPPGRNGPSQQTQGAGRMPQASGMIQSREAARRGRVPQSDQVNQRIIALQQSIIENQQRTIALLEQNNQLQAQMQQLLQDRAAQVQQQTGDQNQLTDPQHGLGQQPQQLDDHVRFVPTLEGGHQQSPETPAPQTIDEQAAGDPGVGEQGAGEQGAGEQGVGEQGVGEQGVGEQGVGEQGVGEQGVGEQGVGEQGAGEQGVGEQGLGGPGTGEQTVGEQDAETTVGDQSNEQGVSEQPGEQGLTEAEASVAGEPQAPQAQVSEGERWTQSAEAQNPYANDPQATDNQQPAPQQPSPQQPGREAQQPATSGPQQPSPQQPAVPGPQQARQQSQQPAASGPQQPGPQAQQPAASGPQQPGPQSQQPAMPGPQRRPAAAAQQPRATGQQQPAASAQQPQPPTTGAQQPQQVGGPAQQSGLRVPPQQGPAAGQKSSADLDAKFARDIAFTGSRPLNSVSNQQTDGAVKAGADDANRRPRGNQTSPKSPTKDGR